MGKNKGGALRDTTLAIFSFVCVFLYFVSGFMHVDSIQIYNAENTCRNHGGLDKYYIHFGADKFDCQDGTKFTIREGKKNPLFLLKSFAR